MKPLILAALLLLSAPVLADTCTGKTPCRACRTCAKCKFCNRGKHPGTCGVCSKSRHAKGKR